MSVSDDVQLVELLAIFGIIGVVVYVVYKFGSFTSDNLNKFFGLSNVQTSDPTKANYEQPFVQTLSNVTSSPGSSTFHALGGGQGSTSDNQPPTLDPSVEIPGTGLTAGDLQKQGWSNQQIIDTYYQGLAYENNPSQSPSGASSSW